MSEGVYSHLKVGANICQMGDIASYNVPEKQSCKRRVHDFFSAVAIQRMKPLHKSIKTEKKLNNTSSIFDISLGGFIHFSSFCVFRGFFFATEIAATNII